jgi:hypothetical protein
MPNANWKACPANRPNNLDLSHKWYSNTAAMQQFVAPRATLSHSSWLSRRIYREFTGYFVGFDFWVGFNGPPQPNL